MALQLADLGEKRITLLNDAESWDELQLHFPKLRDIGGFEMLRMDSGKSLHPVVYPKNGYSIPYLRAVVHHANIYLRPLQKDLCDKVSDEEEMVRVNSATNNF